MKLCKKHFDAVKAEIDFRHLEVPPSIDSDFTDEKDCALCIMLADPTWWVKNASDLALMLRHSYHELV